MKKTVSIIGGGAAAIALAAFLDEQKFEVTIFEKNKALGRKFLVAGKGGFNLTHSELFEPFVNRYCPPDFLTQALQNFNHLHLREWLDSIRIPTYVGSSKRVYPEAGIKPIEVLKAIQAVLIEKKVKFRYSKTWIGWKDTHTLRFEDQKMITSDYVVFALGGGSWKVTGSDGSWLTPFHSKGIHVLPFQASNCGYGIHWSGNFLQKYAGSPLKNISISCSGRIQKGEVVVTKFGLEGNAIYALSPEIRTELKQQKKATITIDLKPSLTYEAIVNKLKNQRTKKTTEILKKELKLSSAQIGLLKTHVSKESFLNIEALAQKMKALPFTIHESAKLDESISTVGGVCLSEVDDNFQLKKINNSYCIGEMLNWDAPTGGYLLQACFSMGVKVARHLNS